MRASILRLALGLALASTTFVYTGDAGPTDVDRVYVLRSNPGMDDYGIGIVRLVNTTYTNRPTCATAWDGWCIEFTFDLKTPGGRAICAAVLEANATGGRIAVRGAGSFSF